MTQGNGSSGTDSVRSVIRSQHPGIANEIQGAINTLRKLQDLAGTPGAAAGGSAVEATADGSASAAAADVDFLPAGGAARPAPLLASGQTFGRYQVVRLLGRGAMGAVYLAYDAQLQRHVALKTPSLGDSVSAVSRFLREARAAAQLRSPYICPVYDVGQIGGVHYLSMAFIDGQPLSKAIAEKRLTDPRAVAELAQKVARGLQKAHEQGIIHRDLKPDNIMIDADGEPIVMDFGLARRTDDVHLTTPGRLVGTPAYMSPEQVDGDPNKIGPATDIYSLGVVLYEMLAGRRPFQGSLTSILRQIGSESPPRPSAVNPALGQGSPLEGVCLTMMARAPADRYPSMAAVADALDQLSGRKRPSAERRSLWARLSSWSRGLFASRPQAPAAGNSQERTLAASGQAAPAPSKTPQTTDQTIDLPRAVDQTHDVPPSTDQTMDLPQSGDRTRHLPQNGDQTLDLPQSGDHAQHAPQSGDQTMDLPRNGHRTNHPPQSADQTLDLPQSGD
jgi:serine/threonine protein kinase